MCGRVVINIEYHELTSYLNEEYNIAQFDAKSPLPRYNVPPGEGLISLIYDGQKTRAGILKWGYLISSESKPLINVRNDSLLTKPMFQKAFMMRRCIILVSGFYEWENQSKKRLPYYFHLDQQPIFALAGIWNLNHDVKENSTCAILTTDANPVMQPIHHRMPIILSREEAKSWLETSSQNADTLLPLLQSYHRHNLLSYPVNPEVNRPNFDKIECLTPYHQS